MFTEERVDNAVEELYQVSISGQQVLDVSNKCSIFRREVVFGDRKCCSVDYVKPENLRTSFNAEKISSILGIFPDLVLLIRMELCCRRYKNSNGSNFQKKIFIGTVEAYLGNNNIFIENFLSSTDLERIISEKTLGLKKHIKFNDYIVLDEDYYDLVLSPKVCSVLIHELVGHFLEECEGEIIDLLPDDVCILAKSVGAFDDEGTPSTDRLIIENGHTLYSKNNCFSKGFFQAGIHGGEAVCRLTNLEVSCRRDNNTLPKRYILCSDINTCQYLGNGKAYISIRESWYYNKNARKKVNHAFAFFVSVECLKQSCFWGKSTKFIGVCTKNHENLITQNEAGFCLLEKQRIHLQFGAQWI